VWVIPTNALHNGEEWGIRRRFSTIFVQNIRGPRLFTKSEIQRASVSQPILNHDGNLPRLRSSAKGLDGALNGCSPFGVASVLFFRCCISHLRDFRRCVSANERPPWLTLHREGRYVDTAQQTQYRKSKTSVKARAHNTIELRVRTTSRAGENVGSTG
jgi:hypothetical protein